MDILTILDSFSRHLTAIPCARDRAINAARGQYQFFLRHREIPRIVSSDHSTHFTGEVYKQLYYYLYTNQQFYFKQFSYALVESFILKIYPFQAIQFRQKDFFQTFQFSINAVFVCTHLICKSVLFQTIHFIVCTVLMSKIVLFQTIQFSILKQLNFKQFNLA